MKFAQVEFASQDDAAKALHGIMQRGKITGRRDGSFVIPEPALDWLKENNLPFRLLRSLNQDDVVQALPPSAGRISLYRRSHPSPRPSPR